MSNLHRGILIKIIDEIIYVILINGNTNEMKRGNCFYALLTPINPSMILFSTFSFIDHKSLIRVFFDEAFMVVSPSVEFMLID